MNEVLLVGNVGQEPELRTTTNGKSVTTVRIATDRKVGDKEYTDWHNVVAWEDIAKRVASYGVGDRLVIKGRLQTRSYEDKTGAKRYVTEVVAIWVWRVDAGRDIKEWQPPNVSTEGSEAPVTRRDAPSTATPRKVVVHDNPTAQVLKDLGLDLEAEDDLPF